MKEATFMRILHEHHGNMLEEKKCSCPHCASVLGYTIDDVLGNKYVPYIQCPICAALINLKEEVSYENN
jgi:hypothetical protein